MAEPSVSGLFSEPAWHENPLVEKAVIEPLGKCLSRLGFALSSPGPYSLNESPDLVASDGHLHILIDFKSPDIGPLSFDSVAAAKRTAERYRSAHGGDVEMVLIGPFDLPPDAHSLAERNAVRVLSIPKNLSSRNLPGFLSKGLGRIIRDAAERTR